MTVEELLPEAAPGRVYGDPYEQDGVTVIPAVKILGASDDEAGAVAKPVGAWVIRDGRVTWKPAPDLNRILFAGIAVTAILVLGRVLVVRSIARSRSPNR